MFEQIRITGYNVVALSDPFKFKMLVRKIETTCVPIQVSRLTVEKSSSRLVSFYKSIIQGIVKTGSNLCRVIK